jgi:GNAT superfamily N-acetyltransferase
LALPKGIALRLVNGEEAVQHLDELTALFREVYAEAPYQWGDEHADLFAKRFVGQSRDAGFTLIEARSSGELIGFGFGVTLAPTTPWWQNLLTPLPDETTHEYVDRTFALVELLVRKPWRRRHVAETIHRHLMQDRHEERATLTVLPAADAAQAAYAKWGWQTVAQKRNPLPGSPVFDVLVKELRRPARVH